MKQKHLRQRNTGKAMVNAGKIKISQRNLRKIPKNDITKLRNRVSFIAAKKAGAITDKKSINPLFKLSKTDFKTAITIKNAPGKVNASKPQFKSKKTTTLKVKSGVIADFKSTDKKFKKVGIVGNAISSKIEDKATDVKNYAKDDGGIKSAERTSSWLERSAAKNDNKRSKYKAVRKAANKEIKAIKKEEKHAEEVASKGEVFKQSASPNGKGLNYNHKQITQSRKIKNKKSEEIFKSTTKKEITFKTKNDIFATVVFKTNNKGVANDNKAFKNRTAGTDNVKFKDNSEKLSIAKTIKKEARIGEQKERAKAGAKRALAGTFTGLSKLQKSIVNDTAIGDPLADGNNIVTQGVLNRIKAAAMKILNKIKEAIKRAIITILTNLFMLILPIIPVLIIVIAVVSIIPFMKADPKKLGDTIPICRESAVIYYNPHSRLRYEDIEAIIVKAAAALGYRFPTDPVHTDVVLLNFDLLIENPNPTAEMQTIPSDDRRKLVRLIYEALKEVGDDYCQIHRHGEMPPAGTYCAYIDEHSDHNYSHSGLVRSFDCSGFVSVMYSSFGGKQLGYRGSDTAANIALGLTEENRGFRSKSGKEMLPGDLIFYQSSKGSGYLGISHVALYIGNGIAIEAYSSMKGVIINPVHSKDKIIFVGRPLYVEDDKMPEPDEEDLNDRY